LIEMQRFNKKDVNLKEVQLVCNVYSEAFRLAYAGYSYSELREL